MFAFTSHSVCRATGCTHVTWLHSIVVLRETPDLKVQGSNPCGVIIFLIIFLLNYIHIKCPNFYKNVNPTTAPGAAPGEARPHIPARITHPSSTLTSRDPSRSLSERYPPFLRRHAYVSVDPRARRDRKETRARARERSYLGSRARWPAVNERLTTRTRARDDDDRNLKMPSTQSVYVSLSILALTGLVGTGVAIGSGVSMMTMSMAQEEQKQLAVASVKEAKVKVPSRGFAASSSSN